MGDGGMLRLPQGRLRDGGFQGKGLERDQLAPDGGVRRLRLPRLPRGQ